MLPLRQISALRQRFVFMAVIFAGTVRRYDAA